MTGRHRRQGKVALAFKSASGALAGAAVIGSTAATSGTALALTATLSASHLPAQVTLTNAASGSVTAANTGRTGPGRDARDRQAVRGEEMRRAGATTQSHGEAGARGEPAPQAAYRHGPATTAAGQGRSAALPSRSGPADPAEIVRAFSALHDIPGIAPPRSMAPFLQAAPATMLSSQRAQNTQSARTNRPQPSQRPRRPRQAGLDEVLRLAMKQVGIREDKRGRNKFTEWYADSPHARETVQRDGGKPSDYRAAAWCDMFVSWIADQTGTTTMGADAYTVKHAKWFQSERRWGRDPRPGALAFFAWEPDRDRRRTENIDHVGLVAKVNRNGTIQTIEGNVNDRVEVRTRSVDWVAGFGYADYPR